jgi:hypothetical protein
MVIATQTRGHSNSIGSITQRNATEISKMKCLFPLKVLMEFL